MFEKFTTRAIFVSQPTRYLPRYLLIKPAKLLYTQRFIELFRSLSITLRTKLLFLVQWVLIEQNESKKKSKRGRGLVSFLLILLMVLPMVLKKNAKTKLSFKSPRIGGRISTKIKRMVLTPLGRSIIFRIPVMVR